MNDLIKKLGLQACDLAGEPDEIDDDKEYFAVTKEFMEKFAELIVRECCQYLENEAERLYNLSGTENDPAFQSNFEICAEKCYDNVEGLKEHFGVEE